MTQRIPDTFSMLDSQRSRHSGGGHRLVQYPGRAAVAGAADYRLGVRRPCAREPGERKHTDKVVGLILRPGWAGHRGQGRRAKLPLPAQEDGQVRECPEE
jgi:hypothetical protein